MKKLIEDLMREGAIPSIALRVSSDELGPYYDFISNEATLRVRVANLSLSKAEAKTGIIYPGGITLTILIPDEDETYHTINLPLPFALLLGELIRFHTIEIFEGIDNLRTDLKNAFYLVEGVKEETPVKEYDDKMLYG